MKSKSIFPQVVWTILILSIGQGVMVTTIRAQSEERLKKSKRAAFRLLLTENQRKTYDLITDTTAQAIWEARYWKSMDPTPTTPVNESYQEHLRRFAYAERHHSNLISPLYLDDRGKYYLKYGEPDDFSESIGIGKEYLSNVTWAYYRFNLFIDFVEREGFGYEEVNDLSEAVRSAPHNRKAIVAAGLYGNRENLHQRYLRFRGITDPGDPFGINQFFIETGALLEDKTTAQANTPTYDYRHDYNAKPLTAFMQAANFRDDEKKTRVELYYCLPLKEITFVSGQTYPLESRITKRISIIDEDGYEIVNETEQLRLAANSREQVQDRLYVNQHNEILKPGIYDVALRLENLEGNRLGILKSQLMVKDFTGVHLQLSDLELASHIKDDGSGPRVKRNNIVVVPYLHRTINKEGPLYIYFEIYNLKKHSDEFTQYSVHYAIKSIKEQRNFLVESVAKIASFLVGGKKTTSVATSFDGSGSSEFQQIYLLVDFGNAPTGKTELRLEVTDKVTGQQAASNMIFTLQ